MRCAKATPALRERHNIRTRGDARAEDSGPPEESALGERAEASSVGGTKGTKGQSIMANKHATGVTGESEGLGAWPWHLSPSDLAQLEVYVGQISCMVVGITVEGATLYEDVNDKTWGFKPQGTGTILLSGRFRELNQVLRAGIPQASGRAWAALIPMQQALG